MNRYVPRTVTELLDDVSKPGSSKPLSAHEDKKAYVLLGAPGAGKTREFEEACKGENESVFVTARDFLALSNEHCEGKTIFIDALDEMRGPSEPDPRRPLDRIRAKLEELGVPKFRLSCRDADWLSRSDASALNRLLPGGDELSVLRLDPLTKGNIEDLANDKKPAGLVDRAQGQGLWTLLENPLTLSLFIRAWKDDQWPKTIRDTYLWGCRQLARELNEEHQVQYHSCSIEDILAEAGLLSAIILLCGLEGIRVHDSTAVDGTCSLSELSGIRHPVAKCALATRLFEVKAQVVRPMHRQVAEFLAAKYLAKRVGEGLSPDRILSLLTERGGQVAMPLRGLAAWLCVHCPRLRDRLFRIDPIGTVSYGDVGGFSHCEKQKLLASLERASAQSPWTLAEAAKTARSRWGSLVTRDMAEDIEKCLLEASSNESKKWLSYALLDALAASESLPELLPELRTTALRAASPRGQ